MVERWMDGWMDELLLSYNTVLYVLTIDAQDKPSSS